MQSNIKNSIQGSLLNLETQRKVAKIGLGVSLGLVTISAFGMKNKAIKAAHIISGIALVGFSIYHHGLYNNGFAQRMINNARKKRNLRIQKDEVLIKTKQAPLKKRRTRKTQTAV
ncbi:MULTISPECIES: helicase [unclassified Campylobacter]|uniref:helicase n=1 Tax=unclassified Campylobacter TaxID=2593542 RepID=UPI003D32987C